MQAAGSEQELPTWPKLVKHTWSYQRKPNTLRPFEKRKWKYIQSNWDKESESMGCVQSKQNKRQGLFQQQEDILTHGNNNKDDSEKVNFSACLSFVDGLTKVWALAVVKQFHAKRFWRKPPCMFSKQDKISILLIYPEMLWLSPPNVSALINIGKVTGQIWEQYFSDSCQIHLKMLSRKKVFFYLLNVH